MRLNLTMHDPTPEQGEWQDLPDEIKDMCIFEDLPTVEEMEDRASRIACGICDYIYKHGLQWCREFKVLIGGAPFFMGTLETKLKVYGFQPVYAFSRRESVEETLPDGSVVKRSVFKHLGFIEV